MWQVFSEFITPEKKIGPDIVVVLIAHCTPHFTSFGSTLCISVLLLDIILWHAVLEGGYYQLPIKIWLKPDKKEEAVYFKTCID